MLQRTWPLQPAEVTHGKEAGVLRPPRSRSIFRAVVDHLARLVRALGHYFAAGGPLS